MATSVVFPRVQFFSNNGKPLIGGKVHTYVAGSSTRARTYKDAAMVQPNTNPIILDARGEAPVYLAEGVEYKFVIEDENDALLMTQEPVYGAIWPNAKDWPSDATLSYQYMTESRAAASAAGPIAFYPTYAAALAAVGSLADGSIIEVSQDETRAGARTRYKVQAGALVFAVNLDQTRTDLASPTGAQLVGYDPVGGVVAGTVQGAIRGVVAQADKAAAQADKAVAVAENTRQTRPAFLEQHISGFFGRGMLTSETINVSTEQAFVGGSAQGAAALTLTNSANMALGGCVTIKHDNGKYRTYFVHAKEGNNIGIIPALRYACATSAARIERTWYNRAHPGKFYMRELAQRIAHSTELDAAAPYGTRVLFTNVSSNPNTLEDTLVAVSGATVNYFAASNRGVSGDATTPVRFALGRSAYISDITGAGVGVETQGFDVVGVADAVAKVAFMVDGSASQFAISVLDELGNELGRSVIPSGANHMAMQMYTLTCDVRSAKRIKVRVACESYAAGGGSFIVDQIDVFEAPQATGKIIANPGAKIAVLGDSWVTGDLVSTPERESICTQLALELPYATIINAGVGGNNVVNELARFDTDVTPHAPDYVVVNTGTNEAYNPLSAVFDPNGITVFLDYYRQLINKIHSIGARPIIIGVPALAQSDTEVPAYPEWQLNDRAKAYARYMFEAQGRKPVVSTVVNANGTATRFPDGTMICGHTLALATTAAMTHAVANWTFPAPFFAPPKVTATLANYSTSQLVAVGLASAAATNGVNIGFISGTAAYPGQIDCIAVGRWYA